MFKEFSTDTHDLCCRISEDVNKGKQSLAKSIIKHYNIPTLKRPLVYLVCAIIKIIPTEKIISTAITNILSSIRSTVHEKDKKNELIKSMLTRLSPHFSKFLQAQKEYEEYTGDMSRHDFLMLRMNPSIELLNTFSSTCINKYVYKFKIPVIGNLLNRITRNILKRIAKKSLLGIFNNIMDAVGKKDANNQYKPSKCYVFHLNSLLLDILNNVKTKQSDAIPSSEPQIKFETNPDLDIQIKSISELLINIFTIESKYHPQQETRKFCKTGSIIRSAEKMLPRESSPKDIEEETNSTLSSKNMPDAIYSILDFIIQDGKLVEKTLYGTLLGANYGLVPERTEEELNKFEIRYKEKDLEIKRLRIKIENGQNLSPTIKSLLTRRLQKEEASFHEWFFLKTPKLKFDSTRTRPVCYKLAHDRQVSYQEVASELDDDNLIPKMIYDAIRNESGPSAYIKANVATDYVLGNTVKGAYALLINQSIFRAVGTAFIEHLAE